ncbi:MAG: hypothetical protein VW405_02940 [Rhodospirillaceae bacterium]
MTAGWFPEVGRSTGVGDAGGADGAAAPGLAADPVGDVDVILAFRRRAEAVAAAEAGAGTAHVDRDQGVATGHEHVAVERDGGAGVDSRAMTFAQIEPAIIGRQHHDGRVLGIAFRRAGEVNVYGQPGAVADLHVARFQTLALVLGRAAFKIVERGNDPTLRALCIFLVHGCFASSKFVNLVSC